VRGMLGAVTYLACTSITTSAPQVVRCSLVRLPRTKLTSLASSWLHLQEHQLVRYMSTHT
jgi:hypothetical protein